MRNDISLLRLGLGVRYGDLARSLDELAESDRAEDLHKNRRECEDCACDVAEMALHIRSLLR